MALLIGIDTGVRTGYAVYDTELHVLMDVQTTTITKDMEAVRLLAGGKTPVLLYIEDARRRTWFGNSGRERLKGAGSICRDAKIWEDFCKETSIPAIFVAPKDNVTKLSEEQFKRLTKYMGRTSEHGRDAAMLVFGRE